ncbi:hypothetical protein Kpol_1012p12 [Vanderwaltozyma polyspora DSM 70294]|uniref:Autophagy protein 5 n=1 Tax=Vanderwaltozyma polyspora (strain ATCC 22028 / DSM 70294 / BCRC 21397 / CBS 2163 / NBRC 10782 / NRRL Y-8283 / UCD 57-17) TaxID=436907 RepID=ATG5_VANPO|nr:uncharacterized protein Kpol_1012p12 [Vanderwaltozyma polyspora DSM 70294]A7TS83.1 RecName: Full=Autophagy protein 5 [Vanderwaltozyma polyspora DSM 70294]EDO14882.1 hypothetical protein Kpol_1012p12 [Vanderwaltozyma polyspora DSM 70294]
MDELRKLVWDGKINVQIAVNPQLLVKGINEKDVTVNLRIPRNAYLMNYIDEILNDLRKFLITDINFEELDGMFWFAYEGIPLYWNYPFGALYDSMVGIDPSIRYDQMKQCNSMMNIWKLQLNYSKEYPSGMIPIVDRVNQIQKYWMHQWKQACFVLNGTSKQVMSLSLVHSQQFWKSILMRDYITFYKIALKIIPSKPRHIPLMIHLTFPEIQIIQPICKFEDDSGNPQTLKDMLMTELPDIFSVDETPIAKVVSHGIEIPFDMPLFALYERFLSCDAFLHLSICMVTDDEMKRNKV